MHEKGVVRLAIKAFLPKIKFNKKLFIPKEADKITLESISKDLQELDDWTFKVFDPSTISQESPLTLSQIYKKKKNSIRIRCLSPFKLEEKNKKEVKKVPAIFIHFHGGGFISGTSFSHQFYLRIWTKMLGCPLFTIDYTNSPEVKYPYALNECWEAYVWIVENIQNLYSMFNS